MQHLRPRLEPPVLTRSGEVAVYPLPIRRYQLQAVQAMLGQNGLLLADDPGMGKTVAACLALLARFQAGQASRAIVVCSEEGGHCHWLSHLSTWAPGLSTMLVEGDKFQRQRAWNASAHVHVADYQTLAEDIEADILSGPSMEFDVLVLDAMQSLRRAEGRQARAVERLRTKQRWGLGGGTPRQAEDWLAIFSLLAPELTRGGAGDTLPDLRQRFKSSVLRRTKHEVASELPAVVRQELWLDLDVPLAQAYREALAEERHRLERLGGSVTLTHIAVAVDRLKQAINFTPDTLDGPKIRALVDLVEEITGCQGKVVIFSPYRHESLDMLMPVLEAYGALRLEAAAPEDIRRGVVHAFRQDPGRRVLLADIEARSDGEPLYDASYVIHFDHTWNPASRRRAEARLYPTGEAQVPVTIYELWMAGTLDERLHALLELKGLLPMDGGLARGTEWEEGLKLDDWLGEILEVSREPGAPLRRTLQPQSFGIGALPPTDVLRSKLAALSLDEVLQGVEQFIRALGFQEVEPATWPARDGGYLLASRTTDAGKESILVRYMKVDTTVGVSDAREVLETLGQQGECLGAYFLATSDFTPSCKKLADESKGQLALVSGIEFYRHLHILGLL